MDVTVNGVPAEVAADPDDTLVELLRDGLGLPGTKLACGSGVCGACTVLVDGTPVVSCLTPCAAVRGRTVSTVEGLAGNHPVQRAFVAHDALQCGYCTPGFVVEAAAFVDRWRAAHGDVAPPRELIADAMAGHLCRCGAYQGVYEAIGAACRGEHDRDEAAPARIEAMAKADGSARYATDVRFAGQLEGVIVRSARAHARVRVSHPGGAPFAGLLPQDGIVRYAGQPVAAVAAPTRAAALAEAARVEVTYLPLPPVLDAEDARGPGAPLVYATRAVRRSAPRSSDVLPSPAPWQGNVRGPTRMDWRGRTAARRIAAARERGDERLVSATFTTAVQAHTPMEPHACVARWDERGELHLYVSTQAVGKVAGDAARRWGLKPAQVHVTAEHVGGGFGCKVAFTREIVAAVELARAAGVPVRVVLSRAEELTDGGNRPGTRTELSLLTGARGELTALSVDTYGDGGTSVASSVASHARFVYGRAPRRLRDFDVVTHRPPGMQFRGPGGPPICWALEQAVDEAAHRLGEDPLDVRRRWDGNPKRQALYDWAAALPVWRDRPRTGAQRGRFRRGVGVAATNWVYILDRGTEVELTVERGVVVARTTVQDMGTGIRTVMAHVVRTELGLPADRVRVDIGRSGTVHGPPSIASRTTASVAPAARDAAIRLRAALRAGAGRDSVLPVLDGAAGTRVVGRRRRDRRAYLTPFTFDEFHTTLGRGFSGAVHVTEVEVDCRLGTVAVTRVWAGIAAGHVYAPPLARSQCHGGIVQGIGFALHEQRHTDPSTGVVLTDNLEDYRIPGIGDTPRIEVHFHQDGWDHVNGHGVGLGEIATVGVAASVGNAVHNATGWRPRDLPVRPDRLLAGIGR
ncbi:molybdopterin-dependent oxidoreductase [Streptomyces beigongshangae]|uniref:molybdopterin-dependent oxidoreductase n=1 Tax=Streptomyces beigongshangae TaxID=2841597 RepID=UPI001C857881|nr:molybdopterin-dependent oxidoreductase [Streptomyces sp. REN17]